MQRKTLIGLALTLGLALSAFAMGKFQDIPMKFTGDPVPGLDFYLIKGRKGYESSFEKRIFGAGMKVRLRNDTGQVLRILDIESIFYDADNNELHRYTKRVKAFPRRLSGLKNGRKGNFELWDDMGEELTAKVTRGEFKIKFIRLEGPKQEVVEAEKEEKKKKRRGHRRKRTESGLYAD